MIISPTTNFVQPNPSKITHNEHDYLFDGFSLFMHYKLDKVDLIRCESRFQLV